MNTTLPSPPVSRRAWLSPTRRARHSRPVSAGLPGSWLAFRANPLALLGLAIVLGLVLVAALAPLLAPNPRSPRTSPPACNTLRHWLGTDELGGTSGPASSGVRASRSPSSPWSSSSSARSASWSAPSPAMPAAGSTPS